MVPIIPSPKNTSPYLKWIHLQQTHNPPHCTLAGPKHCSSYEVLIPLLHGKRRSMSRPHTPWSPSFLPQRTQAVTSNGSISSKRPTLHSPVSTGTHNTPHCTLAGAKLIKPSKKLHRMKQVLAHMITADTPFTPFSFKRLMDLSVSSSGPDSLSRLFSQFRHRIDTDFCNALIKACTRSSCHRESVAVFTIHMPRLALSPDLFTFPPLLKSVAQLCLPGLGVAVHGRVVRMGFGSDVFTSTALVAMYCAFARGDEARQLFDGMPVRNSVSWNAMITGYVHNRRFKAAHELFSQMLASGLELGEVTVVCALSACAHLGALNQGVWIHNYIKSHGLRLNVFVGTALVDMYMKCGMADEAVAVFRAMRVKNVFSWNALISGLATNGRGEAALEAFGVMIGGDINPDGVTFLALLCACCHQGFVEEGRKLFISMEREFGLKRRIEHYGCMVDLLARAGFLEEAYELISTMPMQADAAVWRAFLAGCRIHGNTQLDAVAVEKLVELEPGNGENYVLLSNVLARGRRWSEMERVREVMSRKRIRKVPGCSSIEVDNLVYEFVVGARFEKDGLDEVYKMLDGMKRELKSAGYAAETEMVSYDLEEEEKENSLMHHSEKLALAFGLLRTRHGSALRIVKNLRVCRDCHSFFKLVSMVYQREIILRDRNRFHHFGGGVCSCRDYW